MIENEVILLRSVYHHIGEMINFSVMDIYGDDPHSTIMFKDMSQQKLFFILLVDFLSKTDSKGPIPQISFLQGLSDICDNPSFSVDNSENELNEVVQAFRNWLNKEKNIDIWLPEIDEQVNLLISRVDAIKMSGDVSKHNYLRSINVAKRLQQKLKDSGVNANLEEAMLALPDFYDRVHDDILIYLTSYICEFLNNIRWGIHAYLKPEFCRSFYWTDDEFLLYRYKVPDNIKSPYALNSYWELMNELRNDPYIRKFVISETLKKRY
ncbi:MAG: hypothetical protein K8R40_00095 [Anaerolineaceae bacterium]|nr:hypothetical protein [Anaerolineaceae bacterium]